MRSSAAVAVLTVFLLQQNAEGFSTFGMAAQRTETTLEAAASGRRAFLDASFMTAAAASAMLVASTPVWAEDGVGDLSMPTEEEQKKAADAAAERLRIKAELQKKNAKPMSFTESMAQEKAKQKELQKSKEERRNALCEELGRGC